MPKFTAPRCLCNQCNSSMVRLEWLYHCSSLARVVIQPPWHCKEDSRVSQVYVFTGSEEWDWGRKGDHLCFCCILLRRLAGRYNSKHCSLTFNLPHWGKYQSSLDSEVSGKRETSSQKHLLLLAWKEKTKQLCIKTQAAHVSYLQATLMSFLHLFVQQNLLKWLMKLICPDTDGIWDMRCPSYW